MKPLSRLRLVPVLLLAALAALALGAARTLLPVSQPAPLAGYLPAGALLAIESPDFGALLNDWSRSPERAAWTHSDSYAVFSNSRLFNRLADAQKQFAGAAGVLPDEPLLHGIAGKESLFAWYDIGALEFVYLTRMPAGQSGASSLLRARSGFTRREAAGTTFYVRTVPASGADGPRTVAFAQVTDPGGDLLLLATREDLLADTLTLMASGHTGGDSLAGQEWFREASAAAAPPPGGARPVLHMTLDLARIVPSPYFRSYWIQRNITEMKGFRAAVTDLYREAGGFREERTLLPASAAGASPLSELVAGPGPPSPEPPSASPPSPGPLAALAPTDRGVFSAEATTDAAAIETAVEEKLGSPAIAGRTSGTEAPNPALDVAGAGSASDLETRIDVATPGGNTGRSHPLRDLLSATGADGLLTVDTAAAAGEKPGAAPAGSWVQTRSAVVIRAREPWAAPAVAEALGGSVGESLTAGRLGFRFLPLAGAVSSGGAPATVPIFALTGPKRLFFALPNGSPAGGHLLLLANDLPLLEGLLHAESVLPAQPSPDPRGGTDGIERIAGFSHTAERPPYLRLTAALDRSGAPGSEAVPVSAAGSSLDASSNSSLGVPAPVSASSSPPAPPPFFSGNIRSLSDSFRALESERITERHVAGPGGGTVERQTVVYRWTAR